MLQSGGDKILESGGDKILESGGDCTPSLLLSSSILYSSILYFDGSSIGFPEKREEKYS
jgi:hypothetical protein